MSNDLQLIVYSKLAVLDLSFIPFLILKTVASSIISTLIAWLSVKVRGILEAEPNFCSLDRNPIGDRGTVALAESMKTMNLQTLM